jgi:SAM-dependent methyltransferase
MAVFWVVATGIAMLGAVAAIFWLPGLAIAVLLAMPFLYIAIVLTWTAHRLGPLGGDVQSRIHQLLIDAVGTEGRLLDVGCGSGQLLIRCAQSAPGAYVGLDFWGEDWEYSRAQAERNAALEGVQGLRFVHGSASRLPFADAEFKRVVSCLTFHEVRDVADKTVSVAEALRVLAPGGRFAFVDLFDDPKIYHGREHVLKVLASHGGEIASARSLSEVLDLRFPLNLAQVLKYAVLVSGTKSLAT